MSEVCFDDESDLYGSLAETIDTAKSNMLKAALQVLLGVLVVVFIVLLDHPTFGVLSNASINYEYAKEIWVIKYLFIFASVFYIAVALVYMRCSMFHIDEASFY